MGQRNSKIFGFVGESLDSSMEWLGLKTRLLAAVAVALLIGVSISSCSSSGLPAPETRQTLSAFDARVDVTDRQSGSETATLPETLVAELAALPEVGDARPELASSSRSGNDFLALDSKGNEVRPPGPPVIAVSWDGVQREGLTIFEGVAPDGIDEVALNKEYAESIPASVGEEIEFTTPDGPRLFTVSAQIDVVTAGAGLVLFDFESAQTLFGKQGRVDSITLWVEPGSTIEELLSAVEEILPADTEVSAVCPPLSACSSLPN